MADWIVVSDGTVERSVDCKFCTDHFLFLLFNAFGVDDCKLLQDFQKLYVNLKE
jgi:hypothetical protein